MARSITVALELDDRNFKRGINSADQQVGKLTSGFGGLKTAIGAATAVASGFAVKGILDATLKMENFRTTLTAYLGSQQAANSELRRLSDLANQLPQDLDNITEGFLVLQRNGIDTTSEALIAFSKVAAGNSKDFTQLAEAVADALTGEFERLKEFGIKVSKEQDQFAIRFADGSTKIVDSAQEVVEAVRQQGEEGGKFADVVAGPLNQALSNLNGIIFEASTAFGEGFAPAIAEGATQIKALIEANKEAIASFGELIGDGLMWFLENMDTVVTGIKAFVAAWAVFKVAELVTGIRSIIAAIVAMNAALMANPIGLVVAAIAAATAVIIVYWDDIAQAAVTAWNYTQEAWFKFKELFYTYVLLPIAEVIDFFVTLGDKAEAIAVAIGAAMKAAFSLEDPKAAFIAALGDMEAESTAFADSVGEKIADIKKEQEDFRVEIENTTDATEGLTDAEIEAERAINALSDTTADATTTATQFATSCEKLETALDNQTDATEDNTDATDENTDSTADNTAEQRKNERERQKALRTLERQKERINDVTGSFEDAAKAQQDRLKNERELLDYYGEERVVQGELNDLRNEHERTEERLNRLKEQGLITQDQYNEAMSEANAEYETASAKVEELARANYEYSRSFEHGFKEAFNNFKEDSTNAATLAADLFEGAAMDWRNAWVEAANTGKLSFDDLLKNMRNRIVAFLADAAFIKLTEVIADAFGINVSGKTAGSGGSSGTKSGGSSSSGGGKNIIDKGIDFVKGLFGFEQGGYVAGNRSVIVGEGGPEIFTPSGSGTIIPNFAGGMGGGTSVTYNINALDSRSFVELLSSQPQLIYNITRSQARASGDDVRMR